MAKLVTRRWSFARAAIAGALAWLLVLQGFGFAAYSNGRFAPPAVELGQAISQGGDNCAARRGGEPPTPGQHDHRQCCILWLSNQAAGLSSVTAIASVTAIVPVARLIVAIAWRFPGVDNKPPTGWTSSWSQRAPPRIS